LGAVCAYSQAPAPPAAPQPLPPARIGVPAATPAPAPSVPPDKVVITIGEQKLTAGDFEQMVDALPEQFRAAARGPNRRQFAEQLVRIKIMSAEAHKRKLDESPSVQRQLELQRENLLANALYQEISATTKVEEAAARQYYDQHKADFETIEARHILVRAKGSPTALPPGKTERTEEEALARAQELRKKLLAGEDFAALAKAESDDASTGPKGGELTVRHGQTVPPFEQAVMSLPVGQISEPVKTQFGYHIIRVEKHETKTFEEVRPDIEKRLRPELARNEVENLRKQAPVTLDDTFFGPVVAK